MTITGKKYPNRGFGNPNYDKDKQREIARKAGRAAHAPGAGGHEWTVEEARAAGRKSWSNRRKPADPGGDVPV